MSLCPATDEGEKMANDGGKKRMKKFVGEEEPLRLKSKGLMVKKLSAYALCLLPMLMPCANIYA